MRVQPIARKPAFCWICGAVVAVATLAAVLMSGRLSEALHQREHTAPTRYAELTWADVNELQTPGSPARALYVRVIAVEGAVLREASRAR